MTFEEALKDLPQGIIGALYREKMLAQGRYDAFFFVQECKGNVACIREKFAEYEDMIAHPTGIWVQALAPNTSVRLHKEGFIAGLRDALAILTQTTNGSPSIAAIEPTQTVPTQMQTGTADAQSASLAETSAPTLDSA